jgi:hypothetical protein
MKTNKIYWALAIISAVLLMSGMGGLVAAAQPDGVQNPGIENGQAQMATPVSDATPSHSLNAIPGGSGAATIIVPGPAGKVPIDANQLTPVGATAATIVVTNSTAAVIDANQ